MPATLAPANLIKVILWEGDSDLAFMSWEALQRYTCEEKPFDAVEVEMTELDLACYEVIR